MAPSRLKLTMTVMSIGLAREAGGGCQHECSFGKDILDGVELLRLGRRLRRRRKPHQQRAANQTNGLRRAVAMAVT